MKVTCAVLHCTYCNKLQSFDSILHELQRLIVWHESFIRSTQRAVSQAGHAHSPSEWAESRVSRSWMTLSEDPLAARDRISWRADDADPRKHIIISSTPPIWPSGCRTPRCPSSRVSWSASREERWGDLIIIIMMWSIDLLCGRSMQEYSLIHPLLLSIYPEWRHFCTLRCFRSFILFCAHFQREECWIRMMICLMYKCAVLSRTPPLI